jgi:hypothetical protein
MLDSHCWSDCAKTQKSLKRWHTVPIYDEYVQQNGDHNSLFMKEKPSSGKIKDAFFVFSQPVALYEVDKVI